MKDRWDKAEILGKLIGSIAVPLAVLFATWVLSQSDSRMEESHKLSARLTSFIEPLSSENAEKRLIAVEIAQYLLKQGQLPPEIIPTLERISRSDQSAEVARTAGAVINKVEEKQPELVHTGGSEGSQIQPRVYFHIPEEGMRTKAKEIEQSLEGALSSVNLTVPGIELKRGGTQDQLRYFRKDEEKEAMLIKQTLEDLGVNATLVDLSERYKDAKIRPRHYELWFGDGG